MKNIISKSNANKTNAHKSSSMNYATEYKELFFALSEYLFSQLHSDEQMSLNLEAEESDFVRLSQNKIRQNCSVRQAYIEFKVHQQSRTSQASMMLTSSKKDNFAQALQMLEQTRREIQSIPRDSLQLPFKNGASSNANFSGRLLESEELIRSLTEPGNGHDFCGHYQGGHVISAYHNSKNMSHWYSTKNFCMDFSFYKNQNAVKGSYAGNIWDGDEFKKQVKNSIQHLELMNRPRRKISPGKYKVYLTPMAMGTLASMFSWHALSYSAFQRGYSPFKKLALGEIKMSSLLHVRENFNLGISPHFNELGEVSEGIIPLITSGKIESLLKSSQSAQEFGIVSNGAGCEESPRSLEILPGTLPEDKILTELGTGIYISNLHYLNWSDLNEASVTGMTRFSCFWVEKGQIVSPIEDMRFDVSMYDILGPNLLALTDFQLLDPPIGTYSSRTSGGYKIHDNWGTGGGIKTPGALIEDFKLIN